jgi:hypothetical protein
MLSVVDDPQDMEPCRKLGCHIPLTKPVSHGELTDAILQCGLSVSYG